MRNGITKQIKELTAYGIILSKSPLSYDNGIEKIAIKILLGQKSSLVEDQLPFLTSEIISIIATGKTALKASIATSVYDEILVLGKIPKNYSNEAVIEASSIAKTK